MAVTKTDANGNTIYITDPNGNEIGRTGKITAGILLVFATLFAMILLVAHWPDKMPPLNDTATTKYAYKWFAMTYLGSNGLNTASETLEIAANPTIKKDTPLVKPKSDTITDVDTGNKSSPQTAAPAKSSNSATAPSVKMATKPYDGCKIDINILILLLVGLSGFLGNLVHIGASFTNFIGAGKFKRSWILWYCVKPFTAAALAVGVYIIFRAGFLNSGNVAASVNLYGVVALAILAGLYTDMATQKLKEIFAVVFQTALTRPNPLDYPPLKITSADPNPLPVGENKRVLLSGIGFDNRVIKVKVNGTEIKDVVVNPNSIAFDYKADAEKPEVILYDEKGVEITRYTLITADAAAPENPAPPAGPEQPATGGIKVDNAVQPTITAGKEANITINGSGLDTPGIAIKMGIEDIDMAKASVSATSIIFAFTAAEAGTIALQLTDKDGNAINDTIEITAIAG